MGAQHSFKVATSIKGTGRDYEFAFFLMGFISIVFVCSLCMHIYYQIQYPHGYVYICDGVDGVVLETKNGRKARGPYYLDGVEVDFKTYYSCKQVEPPFND